MTTPVIQADSGFEALIWLVLAAIWGIIQVVGRKKRPPSTSSGNGSAPSAADLESFIEQVTGVKVNFTPAETTRAPQPALSTPQKAHRQGTHHRSKGTARIPLPPSAPPPQSRSVEEPALPLDTTWDQAMSGRQHSSVPLPKMQAFKQKTIHLPILNLSMGKSIHHRVERPAMKGKHHLRMAMVSRILLGPPRADQI